MPIDILFGISRRIFPVLPLLALLLPHYHWIVESRIHLQESEKVTIGRKITSKHIQANLGFDFTLGSSDLIDYFLFVSKGCFVKCRRISGVPNMETQIYLGNSGVMLVFNRKSKPSNQIMVVS